MILCFSGTGNSLYAARIISAVTGDELVSLNDRLRHGGPAAFSSERPFVAVVPTHAWRIPRAVEDLFRRARWEGSRKLYFFLTCGSEPGNAAKYCRRLCAELGMEYMGMGVAVMPENYLVMFPTPGAEEAAGIVSRAEPVIEAAAREIAALRPLAEPAVGTVDRLRSGIVNDLFRTFYVKDRPFRVSDACVGCGRCAALCPVNDIALRGGRPVWLGRCMHCMACINACPVQAIEYGRASAGRPRNYLTRVPAQYAQRKQGDA